VDDICLSILLQGLEEQLLAELVRAEGAELEESHDSLITSISADKRQLGDLESKILRLLREACGNLLNDETLIATLNTAKQTSGEHVVLCGVRDVVFCCRGVVRVW
jgi:dynein heavy chain